MKVARHVISPNYLNSTISCGKKQHTLYLENTLYLEFACLYIVTASLTISCSY